MKYRISDLGPATVTAIKEAARAAMDLYPNAHLGDMTRREDLHSVMSVIRQRVTQGQAPIIAAQDILMDTYRYEDM